jgi:hypothetical protein
MLESLLPVTRSAVTVSNGYYYDVIRIFLENDEIGKSPHHENAHASLRRTSAQAIVFTLP